MLAVFSWGLQYKLSLYDPPQAVSHTMPEAKLLNKDERATVIQARAVDTKIPAQSLFLAAAFLLFTVTLALPRESAKQCLAGCCENLLLISYFAGLNASLRPPPTLL
jgi:hypothetical protein